MPLSPLKHQRQRPPRQSPFQNFQGPNIYQDFILGIQRVKVRRRVIIPEHLDQNPIK